MLEDRYPVEMELSDEEIAVIKIDLSKHDILTKMVTKLMEDMAQRLAEDAEEQWATFRKRMDVDHSYTLQVDFEKKVVIATPTKKIT